MLEKMKGNFVVVTTDKDKRGVFGGKLTKVAQDGTTVVLRDAQMAVYWHSDTHGVLGLANPGPTARCRISPVIPEIRLVGVTAIMQATPEAETKWRKEPWG